MRAGEQIHIVYGTEATTNVELLAHYGFVDPAASKADCMLVRTHPDALAALRLTSLEEDLALLQTEPPLPYKERLALGLRVALKKAAAREGLLDDAAA